MMRISCSRRLLQRRRRLLRSFLLFLFGHNFLQEVISFVPSSVGRKEPKRSLLCPLVAVKVNGDTTATTTETVTKTLIGDTKINKIDLSASSGDDDDDEKEEEITNAVCRIVAASDPAIPPSRAVLPPDLTESKGILSQLDAIYHASAHEETRKRDYMYGRKEVLEVHNEEEERQLVSLIRTSLEDAGFQLLSRRDLDLCECLNVGYLLRLSIVPDLSGLDPGVAQEFYAEELKNPRSAADPLLFGGRVLVFRRGYASEVSEGRMILPKLDYLQASLVQKSANAISRRLGKWERKIYRKANRARRNMQNALRNATIQLFRVGRSGNKANETLQQDALDGDDYWVEKEDNFFKLLRYGGVKVKFVGNPDMNDALTPFMICEIGDGKVQPPTRSAHENLYLSKLNQRKSESSAIKRNVNKDIYQQLNSGSLTCQYDAESGAPAPSATTLLERVSISDVVDLFSKEGRKRLIKRLFETSVLVEPTYEEIVVIWRPLPQRQPLKIVPPKAVYRLAELFDLDEKLPKRPARGFNETFQPLSIRTFDSVPMANMLAVLPKTRLVFRPADALLFDVITVATFLLVVGSLRFDNPRLDVIAIGSVIFWFVRSIIRYSNKLARYDLVVKRFLTSKISHRDCGAFKYLSSEAGSQKARRAALIHKWILRRLKEVSRKEPDTFLTKSRIAAEGFIGVNDLLATDQFVNLDVMAGLDDLEELGLVEFQDDELVRVEDSRAAKTVLQSTWTDIFDGGASKRAVFGERAD